MFKMKKIMFVLLVGIFFLSFTSAYFGTYMKGDTISIKGNLNATAVNISIYYPNSTVAIEKQPMTQMRGDIWNYTFTSTDILGNYIYDYCNEDGDNCKENNFEITPSGEDSPSSGEGIIFLVSVVSMILMALFFFLLSFSINKESALRFGLIGLALIIAIITVLYSSVALMEINAGYTRILNSFAIFQYIILTTLVIIFIFVLVALIKKALDSLNVKRGLKGEDH